MECWLRVVFTTGGVAELSDAGPAWSADNQWVIFSRTGTLMQVHPDGSFPVSLDCEPAPCNHPHWTRAGDKLAYTAISGGNGDGLGENYDIYVLNALTGMRTRLTTSPDQEDNPKWSPDGTMLAYKRMIGQRIQVFRTGADGSLGHGSFWRGQNSLAGGLPRFARDDSLASIRVRLHVTRPYVGPPARLPARP